MAESDLRPSRVGAASAAMDTFDGSLVTSAPSRLKPLLRGADVAPFSSVLCVGFLPVPEW